MVAVAAGGVVGVGGTGVVGRAVGEAGCGVAVTIKGVCVGGCDVAVTMMIVGVIAGATGAPGTVGEPVGVTVTQITPGPGAGWQARISTGTRSRHPIAHRRKTRISDPPP